MIQKRSEVISIGIILIIVIAVGLFAFSRSNSQSNTGSEATQALGNVEGESVFTDLDGGGFSLEQFDGKVRVVNSWATWCPFCINELPDFGKLATEFKDNSDVVVIGINRKEDPARAAAFIAQIGSLDDVVFVQDPEDSFYKSIGGFSMPETVFYDREGNISFHKRGFMTLEEMQEHTNTALNATNDN